MNTPTQPCQRISEFEDENHDVIIIDCVCMWLARG